MKPFPDIPGYVIKKKLGRGGMANVYLAVQEKLSRLVAIKVLIPERFSTLKQLKRFVKEAQIASKLIHPHIVTIYDVGQAGDLYYMVMEYLPETLKERIRRRGRFAPEEAGHILLKLAGALFYAHRQGFIHRDIKSENIIFRRDGTPVIVDFGIARAIESESKLTRTGVFLGTPHYMSPEQCLGKKLNGQSDIYNLGIVLFEMLTGGVPDKGAEMAKIIMRHVRGEVPRLSWSLREYQPLLERMLAKKRRQRPQSERELQELVIPLLQPLEVSGSDTKEIRRIAKQGRNETTVAAVADNSRKSLPSTKTETPRRASVRRKPKRRGRRWAWNLLLLILIILFILLIGGKYGYFGLDNLFRIW